ncbi:MAG: winged helix-turn-helix domain-containing protein [Candidatus Thorarchaeota archaeon]
MLEVTVDQAKRFILDIQGLRTSRQSRSVLDVARRIHSIQIDTISVVTRSHNLIAWNRFPRYKEGDVWKAEMEGKLFEWWSHGMCLMPMETYPFTAWRKQFYPEDLWNSFKKWGIENKELIEQVYQKVKKDGVLNSASIGERKTKSGGWWDWKVEKRALEYLFYTGRLMVPYRKGFQKHYDLTERVLPPRVDSEPLSDDEAAEFVIKTTLGSLGLGSQMDMRTYLGRMPSRVLWNNKASLVEGYLEESVRTGLLEEVSIIGQKDRYFILGRNIRRLKKATTEDSEDLPIRFLSPFDNLIRERHLPQKLWNFEYTIECYTPIEKRRYGYFTLPLLDGIRLVGRVDAKLHRKNRILDLKSLHLEDDFWKSDSGLERLVAGINDFAQFHQADRTKVGNVIPQRTKALLIEKM